MPSAPSAKVRRGRRSVPYWRQSGNVAAVASRSRQPVKEEIDGGDLAVPGDDDIGSGVSRRLARAARDPTDPPPLAHHLRRGERLISEVRMSSLDHARDAVDLVATAV